MTTREASLRENYRREFEERRRLFNLVQELRGNIRVFCRARPPSQVRTMAGYLWYELPPSMLLSSCDSRCFKLTHVDSRCFKLTYICFKLVFLTGKSCVALW